MIIINNKAILLIIIVIAAIFVFISCAGPSTGGSLTIEVPQLLEPENNAAELIAPVFLDWTGNLDMYTLMYSDDYATLQDSLGTVVIVAESNAIFDFSDGTWFWKVKGNKNGIETAYTDIRSFSVGFDLPPVPEEDAEETVTVSLSNEEAINITWPEYKSDNFQDDYVYYEYFIYADDSEMGMRANRLIENATCSTNNATFTPPGNSNRFRSTVLAKNSSNMQAVVGESTFTNDTVTENHPPVNPYGPNPSKQEEGVEGNPLLSWKCYDPDGDELEFDVYFGDAVNAMELVAEQIPEKNYTLGQLEAGQEYFWRIIVRERDTDKQKEKKSPIWSFETMGTESFKISVQSTPSIAGDVRINNGRWSYLAEMVVSQNEQVTIEYREDKDYTFAGWYEQGQLIGEENEIEVLVNEDKAIIARFIKEGENPPVIEKVNDDPSGTIQATSVTFEWTDADEDTAGKRDITEYLIRKDAADWEKNTPALSTTYTWNDFEEGSHTFEVKAKDDNGLESNILKWEFTYEAANRPPIIEKLSFQQGIIHTASTTFIWSAEDADGEIDYYAYSKERGDWQITQDIRYTWSDYAEGSHVFSVKAVDDKEAESEIIRWDFTYAIIPATYTIHVESSPVEAGFIRVNSREWTTEQMIIAEENETITLAASPNNDYVFEGWESDNRVISEANPYTFSVNAEQSIAAKFSIIPNASPTIEKVSGPDEHITENRATFEWTGSDESHERMITKYRIRKDDGSWIDNIPLTESTHEWTGFSEGEHTFQVKAIDDDEAESNILTWTFIYAIPKYTLSLEAIPSIGGMVSEGGVYEAQENITVSATANEDYRFVNWTDNESVISESAVFSYSMPDEDVTLIANFEEIPPKTYTLTLESSPTEGGQVSFDGMEWQKSASKTVNEGSAVQIHAKPTEEYTFEGWFENGLKFSEENPFPLTINSDRTIIANFKAIPNTAPTIEKMSGPDDDAQIIVSSATFE